MSVVFYNKVLLVVVLYKQTINQSLTLRSLNHDLQSLQIRMDVFIYDNSPQRQVEDKFFKWNYFNVFYFHDPNNSGLSKAYNTGARKAMDMQKDWLLLLDQDTTFNKGFFQCYCNSVKDNSGIQIFAPILKLKNGVIFSPCITKHKRGYPVNRMSQGKYSLWDFSPVNSGILIRLKLFLKVKGYNENLKVDFCDFQFLEKIRKIDPQFYVITSIGLQDFSNLDKSIQKQKQRFEIYLQDAINCDKPYFSDKISFFYTVTRHAIGLALKLRNFSFLRLYFHNFLIR